MGNLDIARFMCRIWGRVARICGMEKKIPRTANWHHVPPVDDTKDMVQASSFINREAGERTAASGHLCFYPTIYQN